jgi:hypothetical protein
MLGPQASSPAGFDLKYVEGDQQARTPAVPALARLNYSKNQLKATK